MCIHVYIYIYIYIHTYPYTCICICIYIYIHMICICIFICFVADPSEVGFAPRSACFRLLLFVCSCLTKRNHRHITLTSHVYSGRRRGRSCTSQLGGRGNKQLYKYMYPSLSIYIYIYTCMYVFMCIYMCIYIYIYIDIYMYTHTHTHAHCKHIAPEACAGTHPPRARLRRLSLGASRTNYVCI